MCLSGLYTSATHALMSPLSPVSPHHEGTTSRKRVPIMIRNDTSPEHLGDSDNIASTTPSPVVRTPTPEHKQHEGGFRERKSSRARNLHRQATVSAEGVRDYLLSGSMQECELGLGLHQKSVGSHSQMFGLYPKSVGSHNIMKGNGSF